MSVRALQIMPMPHSRSGLIFLSALALEFLVAIELFSVRIAFSALPQSDSRDSASFQSPRSRTLIDDDWRFTKGDPPNETTGLLYDVRPRQAAALADTTESEPAPPATVKKWILPTGNQFLKDPSKGPEPPEGNLGGDVPYVAPNLDDSAWQQVNLPHDYAIEGSFTTSGGGGMGRLPTAGVAWYRKKLKIPNDSAGKSVFLDIDGAMSYSEVWLNGHFVGGWPYGYASFRLNLTPYIKPGGTKHIGHPSRQSPELLALVSRRRHLSQRLARRNFTSPRRPVGHLPHHAGRFA